MRNQVGALRFVGSFPERPPELGLPEIAFAGRSNVGKSSALNCLLGNQKAARVSSRPGRTQAINLFQVGTACVFADLPGYGYAAVPDEVAAKWKPMIEAYLGEREHLRLVILLVDGRLPAQPLDRMLLDALRDVDLPVAVVATKLDKLSKHERKPAMARLREALELPEGEPVPFSSHSGEGRDRVWALIEAAAR